MEKINFTNESLAVSDNVIERANELIDVIIQKINSSNIINDIEGSYVKFDFFDTIFNINFKVICKCYLKFSDDYYKRKLHGSAKIKERTLELILLKNDRDHFDNIITHELLHIYQYSKNKADYDNDGKYKDLYKIVSNILNSENHNWIKITFANALYMSFPFEQDAMIHGLYNSLINNYDLPSHMVKGEAFKTDEYLYLKDIKLAIDMIDEYDESIFNHMLSKNAFLNILNKSYKRFLSKFEKCIQHVINEKTKLNEGIYYYVPSLHKYQEWLRNKINEEKTLWYE